MTTHQDWQAQTLWQKLNPLLPGISIEVLARTESTNTALLERVRSQARGEAQAYGRRAHDMQPCLLVAEQQTQGRGRMGRSWLSAPGSSLTFSLGLTLEMADWSGLSLALGCAIAEALEPRPEGKPRLTLKWPNDLWLDGRKLGGILIETVSAGAQRMVVIGVGLNLGALAAEHAGHFNSGFASLDEYLPGMNGPAVLALVAPPLVQALLDFAQGGFAGWQTAYARRDLTLGLPVTAGAVEGISQGVSSSGELVLLTQQGLRNIGGGEVSVRLNSAAGSSA